MFTDADRDGQDHCAVTVWCIQDVDMATATAFPGRANATPIGAAFSAIKVCISTREFIYPINFSNQHQQ